MATAGDLTKNIRDQFLQCKICLDGLKDPKTLPCLHTFCMECMGFYIEHNRLDDRTFCCPICRRQTYIPNYGADGFPDSFFVTSLTDIVDQQQADSRDNICGICKFKGDQKPASSLCIECKIQLCEECTSGHTTAKVTEGHTLLPVREEADQRENYCRVHKGESIKYYCQTCNSPICLPCTFLEHKGHEIKEIKSVQQNFNQDIAGLVLQSKDNIIQLTQTKADLVEVENELFIRKEAIKMDIRRTCQSLIRNIQDQESLLINELDTFYDILIVSTDKQQLERTLGKLERAHSFAATLLSENTSPIAQIVNKADAKENLQQALNYELPDVMVHGQKLDQYVNFLPGQNDIHVGSLLKCVAGSSQSSEAKSMHIAAPTKALFMYKIKTPAEEPLTQVLSLDFAPNGDLVILVSGEKKIQVYNKRGTLKDEFGDESQLPQPSDLVVTPDREVAVTECVNRCVKVYDINGTYRREFGGPDIFGLPIAITTDDVGKFLVCDQAKQSVTIHRETGEHIRSISITEVPVPQYISCYGNKVYICDAENNIITIYGYSNKEFNYLAKLSAPTDQDGEFLSCSSICVNTNGDLLITDRILNKIHVFSGKGEFGSITASGKQMYRPRNVAMSRDKQVAVCVECVENMDDPQAGINNEIYIYRLVKAT